MQSLDLVIKAIDDVKSDNAKRMDRLETKIDEGFRQMNGRVRKTETELTKIKVLWTTIIALCGFAGHLVWDYWTR